VCSFSLRSGLRPADLMETLKIDARKLGVTMCLRDCDAVSFDNQSGQSRKPAAAGEKWKTGFKEACERLGEDPCTKACFYCRLFRGILLV